MKAILTRLFNSEKLTSNEAYNLLTGITQKKYNDSQIAALLTVYQMRNITVDELIGFRQALLDTQAPVNFADLKPVDIVGTGGDGKNTFNISTCACFVVAGAGYKVAKHGNVGATSVSGASNVMMQHGIKFTNDPSLLRRSIEECNIVYMHAPLFTPAMGSVAPVRKALQVKTIFNLLGPLVNPCRPAYQVLGVADLNQLRLYTNVYQKINMGFAVVHSIDKYDEISLTGEFKIATNNYERIYLPEDLGLHKAQSQDLFGGKTPDEAAKIFDNVLQNKATSSQTECVIANAACAIKAIESQMNFEQCIEIARESLQSGKAFNTLKKFISINS